MKRVILFALILLFSAYFTSAQICVGTLEVDNPQGVVSDGNYRYVADTNNNRIVIIDVTGVPNTFVGDPLGSSGLVDGVGTAARFNQPHKIVISGNFMYVADTANHKIRKIDMSNLAVTTINGGNGAGNTNGPLSAAKFSSPKGLYVTANGDIFVADTGNNLIRRINPTGGSTAVTTVAGGGTSGINCLSPSNCPSNTAPPTCSAMQFNAPEDVFVYTSSPSPLQYHLYVADTANHAIELISNYNPANPNVCNVKLIAGSGVAGYNEGGTSTQLVQFDSPSAIEAVDYSPSGPAYNSNYNLFIADRGNHNIRQLYTAGTGPTYSVAYRYAGGLNSGNSDGQTSNGYSSFPAGNARFNLPSDIHIRADSTYAYTPIAGGQTPYDFLIADSGNDKVRTITGAPGSNPGPWNVNTLSTINGGTCSLMPNTCPTTDDVILRLSSGTNAHGEEWNGASGYTNEVCYSEIFGSAYSGTNPHSCANNNLVLRLSSLTNAHAEIPDASPPSYTTDICYGDLVCQSVAGNAACPANTQEIVSLSGSTNAHLETASANVYSTSTDYKICCSNTAPPQPGSIVSVGWTYYDGTQVPDSQSLNAPALFCPNSLIYATVITSGLPNGSPVTFNFYDEDFGNDDFIFGPVTANVDNNLAKLPVNFADPNVYTLLNTFIPDLTTLDVELFFDAAVPTANAQSGFVRYVNNISQCQYSPPTASVTAPVHQGVYFANTVIDFVASCSSQGGPLTYNWQLVQNGNTITNANPTFQQTFTQGGQVTVTLTCTDLQGLSATSQVQMLLVASPFAFAYINDPAFNGVEYNPPSGAGIPYFPREVTFKASHSFAVDTAGACVINCLGGTCPTQTQNSPSSCTGTNGLAGGPINIVGAPTTPTNADWTGMTFDWNFWDSDWTNQGGTIDGVGKVDGALEYDDISENVNDKHMSVSVQASSGTNTATAQFQREFTLGRCLNNGNTLLNSLGQLQSTTQPNACNGGDGVPNSGDECCPLGQECTYSTTSLAYQCEFLTNPITRCEDFTDTDMCNGNTNAAYPLASNGGILPATACTFLQCYWIDDTLGCGVRETQYPTTPNGVCDTTQGCVLADCSWTTTQTECVNGKKTISYNGGPSSQTTTYCPTITTLSTNETGYLNQLRPLQVLGPPGGSTLPASCTRNPITVPCGSLNFELDFFGIKQFIVTAIIVALFYTIFGIRTNKPKHE
ncbi:MAG: hypothetical protein ACP5NS_04525 [Candidatus Pacearchaeota archaeon]